MLVLDEFMVLGSNIKIIFNSIFITTIRINIFLLMLE